MPGSRMCSKYLRQTRQKRKHLWCGMSMRSTVSALSGHTLQ